MQKANTTINVQQNFTQINTTNITNNSITNHNETFNFEAEGNVEEVENRVSAVEEKVYDLSDDFKDHKKKTNERFFDVYEELNKKPQTSDAAKQKKLAELRKKYENCNVDEKMKDLLQYYNLPKDFLRKLIKNKFTNPRTGEQKRVFNENHRIKKDFNHFVVLYLDEHKKEHLKQNPETMLLAMLFEGDLNLSKLTRKFSESRNVYRERYNEFKAELDN